MKKKKGNIGIRLLIILLVILLATAGVLLFLKNKDNNSVSTGNVETNTMPEPEPEPVKTVQTFVGTDRPIAVMIDNVDDAKPQAGLNDASLVYEIIVEGGLTRYMAVFRGVELDRIGPVRSSRHYFIDYAMENDAIYVHFGWSPQAQNDIRRFGINNINGIVTPASTFTRVRDKAAPHNAVTSTAQILNQAEAYGYRTTSNVESVLHYVVDEVNLDGDDAIEATHIVIPYPSEKAEFKYNSETKKYERYTDNEQQFDWMTKEPVATKNIIITYAGNTTINDGENKGRQTISNIGTLNGYYITNGNAIKITCTKTSRDAKTVYKDLEGNEIDVNDGNTFIQICPTNSNVLIEGEPKPVQTTETENV